jgi:hypothetical protein
VIVVYAVLRYKKIGLLRFLSAIDTSNAVERNLRRAGAALEFSQGFHKKPRVSFLDPAPTGVFDLALYVRVRLQQYEADLLQRLQETAVEGLWPAQLWWTDLDINKLVTGYLFRIFVSADCVDLVRFDPQNRIFIPEKDKSGTLGNFFKGVHFKKLGKFIAIVYYQDRGNLVKAKYLYESLLVKDCPVVLVQRLEAMCGDIGLSEYLEAKR